jgi:hypothetical protein
MFLLFLYIDFDFHAFENLAWTQQWEVEVLIPNSVGYVQCYGSYIQSK